MNCINHTIFPSTELVMPYCAACKLWAEFRCADCSAYYNGDKVTCYCSKECATRHRDQHKLTCAKGILYGHASNLSITHRDETRTMLLDHINEVGGVELVEAMKDTVEDLIRYIMSTLQAARPPKLGRQGVVFNDALWTRFTNVDGTARHFLHRPIIEFVDNIGLHVEIKRGIELYPSDFELVDFDTFLEMFNENFITFMDPLTKELWRATNQPNVPRR